MFRLAGGPQGARTLFDEQVAHRRIHAFVFVDRQLLEIAVDEVIVGNLHSFAGLQAPLDPLQRFLVSQGQIVRLRPKEPFQDLLGCKDGDGGSGVLSHCRRTDLGVMCDSLDVLRLANSHNCVCGCCEGSCP